MMQHAATCSSVDVALWFIDRAFKDNTRLKPSKLQILLYMSQGSYAAIRNHALFMPCYFVATDICPLEPISWRILPSVNLDDYVIQITKPMRDFLEKIYKEYGHISPERLLKELKENSPYAEALRLGENTIIDHNLLAHYFAKKLPSSAVHSADYSNTSSPPEITNFQPPLTKKQGNINQHSKESVIRTLPNGKKIKKWTPPLSKSRPINGMEYGKINAMNKDI